MSIKSKFHKPSISNTVQMFNSRPPMPNSLALNPLQNCQPSMFPARINTTQTQPVAHSITFQFQKAISHLPSFNPTQVPLFEQIKQKSLQRSLANPNKRQQTSQHHQTYSITDTKNIDTDIAEAQVGEKVYQIKIEETQQEQIDEAEQAQVFQNANVTNSESTTLTIEQINEEAQIEKKRGRRQTDLETYEKESIDQIQKWKDELQQAIAEQKKNSKERKQIRNRIKLAEFDLKESEDQKKEQSLIEKMKKDIINLKTQLRKLEPASQKRNQISAQESRLDKKKKECSLIDSVKALVTLLINEIDESSKLNLLEKLVQNQQEERKRSTKDLQKELYKFLQIK